jgi:hypothetical protein
MTRGIGHLAVRALRDLRPSAYPVATGVSADGRGAYPIDLRPLAAGFRRGPGDVVIVPGPGGGWYHNPVSVSLYALSLHTAAAPGRAGPLFLTQARHLRSAQDEGGGWRYLVPVRRYGVEPGWYSAMAQGLAVSVLLRAHDATGEVSYADAAAAAAALLLRPLGDGGCSHYDDGGRPFPEECAADPPAHILIGALFALIGLGEYEARSGCHGYLAGVARVAAELPGYDLGYWSRYDLRFAAPATMAYHSLHVSLLEAVARPLPRPDPARPRLLDTAARWDAYRRHPGNRLRAAAGKARSVLRDRRG